MKDLFALLHAATLFLRGRLNNVPIETCRDLNGFFYGVGWHYASAFLREYVSAPERALSNDSLLDRFYAIHQPEKLPAPSILDDLRETGAIAPMLGRSAFPMRRCGLHNSIEEEFRIYRHWFGPHSQRFIQKEKQRLIGLYLSLGEDGYRPFRHGGFVRGFFLACGGEKWFVVSGGHHRCAAMSALDMRRVWCVIPAGNSRCVTAEDVLRLADEASYVTVAEAEAWLDAFCNPDLLQQRPWLEPLVQDTPGA